MNKRKLDVEELAVETFQSAPACEQYGTLEAREFFASTLRTCADTNCGKSYCVSAPCAC